MDDARSVSAAPWALAKTDLRDPAPVSRGTIRDRLLGPMDREVALSFTDGQIRELERILAAAPARRLPVDIRITVPFFRRGFFITVLAGPERRSRERRKEERGKHALWTVANACCFAVLLVLFVPTVIGLVHIAANGL
jgi:hypothetical protein